MQSCHDFLTTFPPRPELRLLLLDATLAVCQHLTEQQVLLLGTGQHLEICLNQGGGPPSTQEKIYGSPAVLQRFVWQCSGGQLKRELQHFRAVRDKNVQPSLGH